MSWAELSNALLGTAVVALGVLVCALPLSLALAILLVRTNVYAARLAWVALLSQLIVPLVAQVGAWSAGFGSQGWWPLSQTAVVGNWKAAIAAVTFIHAVAAVPGCVIILSLGLNWISRSREEMAMLDGGKRSVILRVVLPELRGWLVAAAFWSMVPVLTEMVVTNLYQVPTLAEQVYLDISLGSDTTTTYLVSVLLCMVPLLFVAWILRAHLPALSSLAEQVALHRPQPMHLAAWRGPISLLVWSVVFALTAVPIINLIIKAGWQSSLSADGHLAHSWSAPRLGRTLFETATLFTREFQWTILLSIGSATVALLASGILRYWTLRARAGLRRAVDLFCVMLIAMPGPLVASSITWLFLRSPLPGLSWLYDHSLAAPIMAQQTRLLPMAWLMAGGILGSISRQTWEASQIDHLSSWTLLRSVYLRQTYLQWIAGWLLLLAVAAGELSTHLLLLPPGVTTIAQRLFEFLHFGMRYQDSGLCLGLIVAGWAVAIVVWNTRTGRA